MKSSLSDSPVEAGRRKLNVPRLVSLEHRLLHAKDAGGQPIPLRDELLLFLDDPPSDTTDRWQAGADLCAGHGIATSRMAVWRFYRAQILEWRHEQMPASHAPCPDPLETARLQDRARHLSAQRVLEMLSDPRLSPGHLVGLIKNDNQRLQIQLGRDQFDDRVAVRRGQEQLKHFQRIDKEARDRFLVPAQKEFFHNILAALAPIPSGNGT